MAVKIARADGNITTAATWGAVDATSLLDSEAANTALTTSYVESATSTPGAITVDGLAVKIRSRSASPTGTMSVRIAQAGATVAGTEVTVNVSDIPTDQQDQAGWFFCKFAAPVLLVAATLYTVSAKTSTAAMVTLYRNATAGNWSRLLRTTTTGAPAAADDCFVLGEWTAAATKTNRAVTIDTTAATDYGSASTTLAGWGVSSGGTLQAGTTAATTYILQLSARLVIWYGGILNTATVGTPMPRDSKLTIQFDSVTDGDFGLLCYGTHVGRGQSRTSGKTVVRCLLSADVAAAGTTLTVDTDTGWLNTDDIAIAGTGTNTAQGETRTLNANALAGSMTISAGMTNAHLGTSPRQAEVILLTRNVVIRAVTAGQTAFVYYGSQALVDLEWHEFRYLGAGSAPKRGIEFDVSTGSAILNYCSHRDFDNHGLYMASATWNNITITNHVSYQTATGGAALRLGPTTGSTWTITDCCFIGSTSAGANGISIETARGTMARMRVAGYNTAGLIYQTTFDVGFPAWTGFEIHSCTTGISLAVGNLNDFGSLLTSNIWHNTTGLLFSSSGGPNSLLIDSFNFFGNTDNVNCATSPLAATFRGCTFTGTTAVASARGIKLNQSNSYYRVRCENCTFGVAAGIKTAHTIGDIDCTGSPQWIELTFVHTLLSSATEIANATNPVGRSYVRYQRVDQVTNVHKTVYPALGTLTYETTTFKTVAPSEKLTPSGATATSRLPSSSKFITATAATTRTIGVYVQKDGSYTGSAPRLVLKANPALGLTTDSILDTLAVASGTWELLSGVTPSASENGVWEAYVDCDGSAGNVYVDEWTAA